MRYSGIIPAYAGNTADHPHVNRLLRDHPRVCGEHPSGPHELAWITGSTPRMRGTLVRVASASLEDGIIPAYAGNTNAKQCRKTFGRDHPRVCGEHYGIDQALLLDIGSSPRMRGTHVRENIPMVCFGIIPAYAGNTYPHQVDYSIGGDHPRVCGEHPRPAINPPDVPGSSPRMRGTRQRGPSHGRRLGIIPAYAGNTQQTLVSACNVRDHPRVCGEHYPESAICGHNRGSSPRMRGTHNTNLTSRCHVGIIPAYAGNTYVDCARLCAGGDHPRVCGEHSDTTADNSSMTGSSPRMRGTRLYHLAPTETLGIIPAYAGNTCST